MTAEWIDGEPANLEAAAEDADAWLELIQQLHSNGRWRFSAKESVKNLRACRENLRKMLMMTEED